MGLERRRRGQVAPRRPGQLALPVEPTEPQFRALAPLISQSIALYAANPQPDSTVEPWWMPTNQLARALAEHGVPLEITEGVLRRMERDGDITRRYMSIDRVVHPVAMNNGNVAVPSPSALGSAVAAIDPTRLGLAPRIALERPR